MVKISYTVYKTRLAVKKKSARAGDMAIVSWRFNALVVLVIFYWNNDALHLLHRD